LKRHSTFSGRFALTGVAAAALYMTVPSAWALGLGRLAVQSALGETLKAEIDVTSITPEESNNLRIRVAPPESYRTAGVDYNPVLPGTQATLARRADGTPVLRLTSDRAVQEPFVDVILEISWATGRLVREYTLLFDPPVNTARATPPAAATAAPVMAAAAPAPNAPVAAPSEPAASRAERKPPVPAPAPKPVAAQPATVAPKASGADSYRVKQGDSLSRIAATTQRPGVSLDQMLVGLYRSNPQAFVDNNMNRLKAGVVLDVPAADALQSVAPPEARQIIQAQSADFGAYRQRLAGAVPAARTEGSARQASGKVEAAVEDRKQAAAATPDKLTLSKGPASKASMAEDKISKESEKKDASTRVAELSKNVDELKKLSGATAASKPASVPTPVAAPAVAVVAPPPAPPAPPPPAPPASPPPAPPAPPPVVAAPPASAPAAVAAPAITPPPAPAPVVAAAASTVEVANPGAAEPGMLGTLMDDNPIGLAVGGGLVALLAGFGLYRFSKRARKDSGETSFLESRLQPDSFFGASGGQRIDTRDAGGASSSMSYSLSQLDAIGDVDPVAEADVYLAYGRDLQAEEILKEAMRSTPERMAIRTKLLEVYAKRRDTKGFELLATQLFALTRGSGEDWAKAQEMGAQVDPENPLYQPGGAPPGVQGDASGKMVEPLGASTMPQSVLPSPSQFGASGAGISTLDSGAVDLDLDLDLDPSSDESNTTARTPLDTTQPVAPRAAAVADGDMTIAFTPPPVASAPPPAPAPAPTPAAQEFDLSGISLDFDLPESASAATPVVAAVARGSATDFGAIELPAIGADGDAASDPISRKLELAEEFRQIGDTEGARDLLQEVVAKAEGALKAKAQGMLDNLS
jgi:pilus assembly protein FimV